MAASRRRFVKVLGGGVILAAGAGLGLARCDAMPEEAVAAWGGPDPAEADVRRRLVAWAILAPNPHNRQPWLIDLREPGTIVLGCDRERRLPQTDPFGRQITIGCGAFLELLDLAASAEGLRAEIAYFPEGGHTAERIGAAPVARIRLAPAQRARDPLFDQIPHRRTNREAYDSVPHAEAAALNAALGDGAVRFGTAPDEPLRARLRRLTFEAWEIEAHTARTMQESVELMRVGADQIARNPDGIALHGPMFWWGRRLDLLTAQKIGDPSTAAFATGLDMFRKLHDSAAGFVWLATAANDRESQLRAGRAYARLNLAATARGLAMQPFSQALQEYPEMAGLRSELHRLLGAGETTVQMLARVGRASPPGPAPRRPLREMLLA